MGTAPSRRPSLEPTGRKPSPGPSVRGLWALAFVVLALGALVAVPVHYGRQVTVEQERIVDILEPAVRNGSQLLLVKAQQWARMEGYLATQDSAYATAYTAVKEQEDELLARLTVLSHELDAEPQADTLPGFFERVERLTTESIEWHLNNQLLFESGVEEGAREVVRGNYQELEGLTRELVRAINGEVTTGRLRLENAERERDLVTIALSVLALLATAILGRVGVRYRGLLIERETRRREAVQARREIDALLEATGDGVLGIDLDGCCISLNRAGSRLLGYSEREITGRDVHATLFHSLPDGTPLSRDLSPLLAAVGEGRPLRSADGAVMWRRQRIPFRARWTLQPLMDGTELRGAVLTFTDMTEIHEKEEALRRAIRQREDVVSIVSHDLRNPLGVAMAAADLLLDLPLDEGQRRRQAEIIRRSGERMQHLIEDLLDVSRIEAGALVVRPSLEELLPILEEARGLYADQAAAKGVRLDVQAVTGDPQARIDRDRIMQALSNLLDNAVRLTPAGGRIVMSAREEGDEVIMSVSDTGPGIEPDLVEGLFDRFAQGNGRNGGAAGLGLTIVRGVAVAHDGEVTVATMPGEGSVFTLRLPRWGPAAGEEARRGSDA